MSGSAMDREKQTWHLAVSQASSTESTRKGLDCDKSLSYPNAAGNHTRSASSWGVCSLIVIGFDSEGVEDR